jgi:hypothetical protein
MPEVTMDALKGNSLAPESEGGEVVSAEQEAALDEELQKLYGDVESSQQEMKELNDQMTEKHRLLSSLSSMKEEQQMLQMFNELEIMKQALLRDAGADEEAREIMEEALADDEPTQLGTQVAVQPDDLVDTAVKVSIGLRADLAGAEEDVDLNWDELQATLAQAKQDRDEMKLMKEQLEMELDLFAKELER